jgi:hypothetical protein
MQNLADAIDGDGSGAWGAVFTTDLDGIDADGVVVIYEKDNDAGASEIYGTNWDAGDCQIVDFGDEYDYTSKTLADIPDSDPASTNFGMRRTKADVVAGEMHYSEEDDVIYFWDADAEVWQAGSGSASIPDATSASGGGVKGKITVDSDYGLAVSTGILSMNITADKGLYFNSGALEIEIDDTPDTLDADADGLKVVGVPSLFKIGGTAVGATVTAANLDDLTDTSSADALHTHTGSSVSLNHSDLGSVTEDQHHNRLHTITSSSDHQVSGETAGHVLTITGTGDTFAWAAPAVAAESTRVENTLVALENIAISNPVYMSTTSGKVGKALANTDAKARVVGIAKAGVSADDPIEVISEGIAPDVLTGATPGDEYWLDAAGGLVVDPPSGNVRAVFIGIAVTDTDLYLQIQDHGKKPS